MIIRKIKPEFFGKISGREFELKEGINLIYGENEAGKSTLHAFIKGMLFGIERLRGRGAASKEDIYTRFQPWDYPGAYGGLMDIEVDNKLYRLQRSFHASNKYFTVTDMETGREVKLKEGHISGLIPNLTETTFRNTISIEQLKAETDGELAAILRNYIANLSIAGSREVNVDKAISYLKEKKKILESVPYAIKLKNLKEEIEEGIKTEEKINTLNAALKDMENEKARVTNELNIKKVPDKKDELMADLPAILEKYRNYNELKNQYFCLNKQAEELKNKLKFLENEVKKVSRLKDDLNEARTLDLKCVKYRETIQNLDNELEEKTRNKKKNRILYIGISAVITSLGFYLTGSVWPALGILSVLMILGGIICVFSNKNSNAILLGIKRKINEIKEQYQEAEGRINRILFTYQAASLNELNQKLEEYLKNTVSLEHGREFLSELNRKMKELEDDIDGLHDTIMIYMSNFISEEELTPEAIERLKGVIYFRKQEAERQQNELKERLDSINLNIEKIKWELSNAADNEVRLMNNKEEYDNLIKRQRENEIELSAINLAMSTILEISETIHDSFGKKLNQAVSEILSEVTGRKYQKIYIDEKLNVKLEWNDNNIILDRLSAGTINQVYLALRIAVADMILGKDKMPLILDDSFALYDDKRLKAALKEIACRSQVLIFSCQMREKQILDEMGLPYNFIGL